MMSVVSGRDGLSSRGESLNAKGSIGRVRDIVMLTCVCVCVYAPSRTRVAEEAKLEERDWYLRP